MASPFRGKLGIGRQCHDEVLLLAKENQSEGLRTGSAVATINFSKAVLFWWTARYNKKLISMRVCTDE